MDTPLQKYFKFVFILNKTISASRTKRMLTRLESVFRKPLIEAVKTSELIEAIKEATKLRKTIYNGGHQDEGQQYSKRMEMELISYFRWAYGERYLERNIYTKGVFKQPSAPESYHLTEEQTKTILQKLDELELKDQLILRLLLDTGVRISELCKMKVKDIDLIKRQVWVFMTKCDRPKTAVFSEPTRQLLEIWLRGHDKEYLFPSRQEEYCTTQTIRLRLHKIGKILGFRTNPHAFRHTMATLWLTHGAQETEIMKQLGHVDRKQIARYSHPSTRHLHTVQERVNKGVLGV